jgi:hypothetical protein
MCVGCRLSVALGPAVRVATGHVTGGGPDSSDGEVQQLAGRWKLISLHNLKPVRSFEGVTSGSAGMISDCFIRTSFKEVGIKAIMMDVDNWCLGAHWKLNFIN